MTTHRRRNFVLAIAAALLAPSAARASNYALEEIPQAIPADEAKKLKSAGVGTTFALLEKAADPRERKLLAKTTKIPEKTLEGWIQMADLLRVKGIGPDVARLLSAAGTRTVQQLQKSNPSELNDAITKANAKQKLSENPPSVEHLQAWIAQSKTLPIVLR